MRRRIWTKRQNEISCVLAEFRGLKSKERIKGMEGKSAIEAMLREDGIRVTDDASISNVLASFYEDLYTSRLGNPDSEDTSETCPAAGFEVEPFTIRWVPR